MKDYRIPSLLSLRLWIGRKFFGTLGWHSVKVSPWTIIKGPCEITEVAALRYVTENTSVPVPEVIKVHHYDGRLYIEMRYIPGMDLQKAWLGGHLSEEQKINIVTEIVGYVSQLRTLNPPHEQFIGSADLGMCFDHRVGSYPFGPFADHQGFHSFLRRNLPIDNCAKVFGQEVTECHSRRYKSCFTHADLAPRNILVNNGKVSAIIDWEFGGWYPEYWEYTKAHYGQLEMPDWYEGLKSAMDSYDDELKAERALWKQCDEPGMPL